MSPDYLNPDIPANTNRDSIPIVDATAESLRGYGSLVESPDKFPVEIVRWPAKGWRPVDIDSGDEAGTTEGVFTCEWLCFRFSGNQGLYIHPDVWHEGVFALAGTQRFFDKQGAVHARVSVDFPREFHCLLEVDQDAANER